MDTIAAYILLFAAIVVVLTGLLIASAVAPVPANCIQEVRQGPMLSREFGTLRHDPHTQ